MCVHKYICVMPNMMAKVQRSQGSSPPHPVYLHPPIFSSGLTLPWNMNVLMCDSWSQGLLATN